MVKTSDKKANIYDYTSAGISGVNNIVKNAMNVTSLRERAASYSMNATLANQDADEALRVGAKNAMSVKVERDAFKGQQKSAQASSGFSVGSGDFSNMLEKTDAYYGEVMAGVIADSERQANSLDFESKRSEIQANYLESIASRQATWGAVGGALDTVSGVSNQYSRGRDK